MNKPGILVFAYHNVGYECLDALIENDEYIVGVVTHKDDPGEEIWFRSVAKLARKYDIPVYTPEELNAPDWVSRIRQLAPDIIFSFYYRDIIGDEILAIPRLGAFNIHGSLLPRYRGRAPVNWAVLNGETMTGATLHHMTSQADAGDIVDQEEVMIGPDDTAADVLSRVAAAARTVLERQIENIKEGTAPRTPQDGTQATTFGRRRPEDGQIDWTKSAKQVYDLVRAVTHPYPGAFTTVNGKKLFVWWAKPLERTGGAPGLVLSGDPLVVAAGSGSIELLNAEWADESDDEVALEPGQKLGT